MPNVLPIISQKGIKALIKKRLENPDLYLSKPLVIRRSDFRDGIQSDLLRNVLKEYNKSKPEEEKKWYRETLVGDISQVRSEFTEDDFKEAFPTGISKDIVDKFYLYVKEHNL